MIDLVFVSLVWSKYYIHSYFFLVIASVQSEILNALIHI